MSKPLLSRKPKKRWPGVVTRTISGSTRRPGKLDWYEKEAFEYDGESFVAGSMFTLKQRMLGPCDRNWRIQRSVRERCVRGVGSHPLFAVEVGYIRKALS